MSTIMSQPTWALLLAWAISALIVAGLYHAHVKGEWPNIYDRRSDLGHAILAGCIYGLTGPVGIIAAVLMTGFAKHGWSLK